MKYLLCCMLGWLSLTLCQADWVWVPEIGWVNEKYDSRTTAKQLYQQGQEFMQQKKYAEATAVFRQIADDYPNLPETKEALYALAECEYLAGNHYAAYLGYEEYLAKNPNTPHTSKILEKEYQIGSLLIQGKGERHGFLGIMSPHLLGIEVLQKIIKTSPYAHFADDAQLMIAHYYFAERLFKDAQEAYQKLIQDYPQSEWRSAAHYQLALCSIRQFSGIAYDREALLTGEKRLNEFFAKYPTASQIEEARKTHRELRENLAQKEMAVAAYYLDEGNTASAKIYLYGIVREFADTRTALSAKAMLTRLKAQGK